MEPTQSILGNYSIVIFISVNIALCFFLVAETLFAVRILNNVSSIMDKYIKHGKKAIIISTLVFLTGNAVLIAWSLNTIKDHTQKDLESTLLSSVFTNERILKLWISEKKNTLEFHASDKTVIQLTSNLINNWNYNNLEIDQQTLQAIRGVFLEYSERKAMEGFFVIAPDGTNLASMRNANLLVKNIVAQERKEFFDLALKGETVMVPPLESDVEIPNNRIIATKTKPPTMFFFTPIKSENGEVIAVLSERFDPLKTFSNLLSDTNIGKSGETLLFDKDHRILNESRHSIKLLEKFKEPINNTAILAFSINDLSIGSNNLLENKEKSLFSFVDFRGEKVNAIWYWIDDLGVGILKKIDSKEAMKLYSEAKTTIFTVELITLFLTTLCAFCVFTLLKSTTHHAKSIHNLKSDLDVVTGDLTRNEAKLSAIFGSFQTLVIIIDGEGKIEYLNDAFTTLFSVNLNHVKGKTYKELLALGHKIPLVENLQTYTDRELNVGVEMEACVSESEVRCFLVNCTFLSKRKHGVEANLYMANDISQMKELQNEVIKERNRANNAYNLKLESISIIGHELRARINELNRMLEIINKQINNPEISQKVELVLNNGEHISALIEDRINFSKFKFDKTEVHGIDFDFRELVEQSAKSIAFSANEKNIEIILNTSNVQHDFVMGDCSILRLIIFNLLSNAVAFTKSGDIYIKASSDDQSGQILIKFSVTDTGIGFKTSTMKKLFDEPTQADQSQLFRREGVGPGLATCKTLIKLLNGNITVESIEGQGSKFMFTAVLERSAVVKPKSGEPIYCNRIFLLIKNKKLLSTIKSNLNKLNISTTELEINHTSNHLATLSNQPLTEAIIIDDCVEQNTCRAFLEDAKALCLRKQIILSRFESKCTDLRKLNPDVFLLQKPFSESELEDSLRIEEQR